MSKGAAAERAAAAVLSAAEAPEADTYAATARAARRPLVATTLRRDRGWVVLVLVMMLVETLMSLAGPWPPKAVLASVLGTHKAPAWIGSLSSSPSTAASSRLPPPRRSPWW